jgi:hypothetical protein
MFFSILEFFWNWFELFWYQNQIIWRNQKENRKEKEEKKKQKNENGRGVTLRPKPGNGPRPNYLLPRTGTLPLPSLPLTPWPHPSASPTSEPPVPMTARTSPTALLHQSRNGHPSAHPNKAEAPLAHLPHTPTRIALPGWCNRTPDLVDSASR